MGSARKFPSNQDASHIRRRFRAALDVGLAHNLGNVHNSNTLATTRQSCPRMRGLSVVSPGDLSETTGRHAALTRPLAPITPNKLTLPKLPNKHCPNFASITIVQVVSAVERRQKQGGLAMRS